MFSLDMFIMYIYLAGVLLNCDFFFLTVGDRAASSIQNLG